MTQCFYTQVQAAKVWPKHYFAMVLHSSWCQKNDLIVNLKPGKTEIVLFGTAQKLRTQPSREVSINGETINRVNQYKYLGVTFDQQMSFSEQLSKVSKKVSQRIKMLKRVRLNITSATANLIYNSMIAPMMLYCFPVYLELPGPHKKFTKLETRAYKTIKAQLQNTITNKIKQISAVEVFKHIHQLKKNDLIKFDDNSDNSTYTLTVVLSTLLYACETWTLYSRDVR